RNARLSEEEYINFQIPSIKQSQSRSLVQSTGRLKRDIATISVDESGPKTLICNCCQNVICVGGEEEEIQNVKARTIGGEGARSRGLGGALKIEDGELSKGFPVIMNYQHLIAGETSYHNKHECISRQVSAS
ncbi:hypothetical protein Tco_1569012, partial [Tanacetum coccineum]